MAFLFNFFDLIPRRGDEVSENGSCRELQFMLLDHIYQRQGNLGDIPSSSDNTKDKKDAKDKKNTRNWLDRVPPKLDTHICLSQLPIRSNRDKGRC